MSIREKLVDEHPCCTPFLDRYGQPTLCVFEMFPTASSYAEYLAQDRQLRAFLKAEDACVHIQEIAMAAHRVNCGNDDHVANAKRTSIFDGCGIDPETIEAILNCA